MSVGCLPFFRLPLGFIPVTAETLADGGAVDNNMGAENLLNVAKWQSGIVARAEPA